MPSEADLSRKMVKAIRDSGGWAVKTHGDPRQRRGLPDIIGCYRSVMLGLEVKLPGKEKTLTPLQADTLADIRRARGVARLVTTVEEVEKLLAAIRRYRA